MDTAANTPLPAAQQTTGDCKSLVCDGAGNTVNIANTADLPPATSQCTTPTCTGGTPSNPPKATGTACAENGGIVCNATGQCVACNGPTDCPMPSSSCLTRTCTTSMCGTQPVQSGSVCGLASCTNGVANAAPTCDGTGNCITQGTTMCAPYACGASQCLNSCTQDGDCTSPATCDTGISKCTSGPKCTDYCAEMATNCTGTNAMYPATANCLAVCAVLPPGTLADMGGQETLGCRLYHGGAAAGDPVTHCPHAGPAGESVCGDDCTSFCIIAQGICTGTNAQFPDMATCMSQCAMFPTTPAYNATIASGNSFACRMYHLTAAALNPVTHCPHIVLASAVCF
jgi:hypothetical protein